MVSGSGSKPRRSGPSRVDIEKLEVVLLTLRERLDVTQKEIAARAELSPAMIARLESGDRRPSRDVLRRLAAVFGTTAQGLMHAARRVSDGEDIDRILDELPRPDDPSHDDLAVLPIGMAGSPVRPSSSSPDTPSPHTPESRTELRVRLALEQLSHLPDTEAAGALLIDIARWLAEAGPDRNLQPLRQELEELLTTPARGVEPVAAMPSGEVRYVFAHALGKDARGQLWVDPRARARIGGYDNQDPRVERYDDGRIVVDISRLANDVEFNERDHERHLVRALVEGGEILVETNVAEVYASTVIEIQWDPTTTITVEPRPAGTTEGRFPDGVEHIHVITAFNPRSRLLRTSENQERNRLLRQDLDAAGHNYAEAVGRSPDTSWSEDSYAIIDGDREQVLELGRRYEQTATFEWTPERLDVVWTDPARQSIERGWSAREPQLPRSADTHTGAL